MSERPPHLFKNFVFQELNCHRLACSTDDDFHNLDRKSRTCNSTNTHIQLLALQDGTTADVLTHPRLGHFFADNRVDSRYEILTALLCSPSPNDIIQTWSKPIDSLAPEELETPDPTSFPDDIINYLIMIVSDKILSDPIPFLQHRFLQQHAISYRSSLCSLSVSQRLHYRAPLCSCYPCRHGVENRLAHP
jgi:hypothetical protein